MAGAEYFLGLKGELKVRLEAQKRKDGFFIPMNNILRVITEDKVLMEVKILKPPEYDEYNSLDRLIGIATTGRKDASINHDSIIYRGKKNDDVY